jgi:hypothetical protein
MAVLSRITVGSSQILVVDADPSVSGVSAPIASIAFFHQSSAPVGTYIFIKNTVSNTGWINVISDGGNVFSSGIGTIGSKNNALVNLIANSVILGALMANGNLALYNSIEDSLGLLAFDVTNRLLYDLSIPSVSIDLQSRNLYDSSGGLISALSYSGRTLNDTLGNQFVFWDNGVGVLNNNGLGIGAVSPSGMRLYVLGTSRLEPTLGAKEDTTGGSISTSTAAPIILQTIPIPTDMGMLIESRVTVRKTGGAGIGTTGDVNAYIVTVKAKNVGGTVTIGVVQTSFTSVDISGLLVTFVVSGTNVVLQVTGATSDNLNWLSVTKQYVVS